MSNKTKSKTTLTSILKKTGFFMPTTEKDVEEYDKLFGNTDIILPQDIENLDWLFKNLEETKKSKKNLVIDDLAKVVPLNKVYKTKAATASSVEKNDYFKKLVLAAEVTDQLHTEPTFGHVKFVKLLYLCEEVCNMKLSTNYVKHAAGPFDPKFMYTAIAEFKRRGWFTEVKRINGYGFKYEKGENAEEFKSYYPKYFKKHLDSISTIIELFRKQKTDFCEIVATLYFVWKEALLEDYVINDSLLITHFYAWGKEKEKFDVAKLENAISWMKKEQVFPTLE